MQENTILKIAIITSIIGLFSLYVFTEEVDLESKLVYDLDENIIIEGVVKSVTVGNNSVSLVVEKKDSVKIILFDRPYYTISKGDILEIKGKVSGDLELIGEEIRKIK